MTLTNGCGGLHDFAASHIDQDCTKITGHHENELFFNCEFDDLRGLTLKDCDLNRSRFTTSDLRKALGFTLTLGCHSFDKVEYSELLFDLFLLMAYKSKGNDAKREKLLDVIGRERAEQLLRILSRLER